jgi:aspartyl-tRNA(Asn)/glutamyl-tRNA(Gln) amidotransferase subunit C
MDISQETIQHLAHLARLSFEPVQQARIQQDLSNMVGFIEQLQEVDTTGVEPLLFMSEATNIWRTDEISGSITQQEALKSSPIASEYYFKVPTVIKK